MHWIQKRVAALLLAGVAGLLMLGISLPPVDADVWVNGYTRKDGTYVQGHFRSNPDGNPYNNWSYPGNVNPHTGAVAPGNPDTYLDNYYHGSGSSSGSSSGLNTGGSGYSGTSMLAVPGGSYIGGTLFCTSGYYKQGETCLRAPAHATAYGGTSFYCDYGYYQTGGLCEKLPDHAYALSGTWYCYAGYVQQGNQCVARSYTWTFNGTTSCTAGYVVRNNQCLTHTQDCQLHYGAHVLGTSRLGGGSSCTCASGYTWNSGQTACIPHTPAASATQAATGGSLEDLQRQIQALLATIAALQHQLASLQQTR